MNKSKIVDKRIGFYEEVCTQTLDKTLEITDEKVFSENGKIYREWNPYNCKLAAAIKNGLQIMPILKNSKVLCMSDNISTIIHISDLVDENGIVFVKNFDHNSEIKNSLLKRKNIVIINKKLMDNENKFDANNMILDVIFLDYNKNEEPNGLISENKKNLKNNGFLMIVKKNMMHNEKIDENMPEWMKEQKSGLEETRNLVKKLSENFEILQVINLGLNYMSKIPYHKSHSFILSRSWELTKKKRMN